MTKNKKIIFIRAERLKFELQDLKIIKTQLSSLELRLNWKRCSIKKGDILISQEEYKKFKQYLKNKIKTDNFINIIEHNFNEFQKNELKKAKNICKNSNMDILHNYRQYEIKTILFDFIINLVAQFLYNQIKKQQPKNIKLSKVYEPEKHTLAVLNVISLTLNKKPLLGNLKIDQDFINKNKKELIKHLKKTKLAKSKKTYKSNEIANLKKLFLMYDNGNYIYKIISIIYFNIARKNNPYLKLTSNKIQNNNNSGDKNISEKIKLKGTVAYPGNFSGKTLIITDPLKKYKVDKNTVIIASETEPALVPYMLICKGIITEKGGILSHAAIIAREIKKPCIIGVENCLQNIKNKETITVKNGIITKKDINL